jgi:ethanolamine ammonia-lyase small subunit
MKRLTDYTNARVSLGLAGHSLPTEPLLDFRLAHARARDAVQFPLDTRSLLQEVNAIVVHSAAKDRNEYLRRPDKGRRLNEASAQVVAAHKAPGVVAIIIADGLSALAIHRHAIPLLAQIETHFENPSLWLVEQGRLAIGDHIGELLEADLSIVLIGERPGLSSPDSLGIYLTWQPRTGRTDAERNCISNIHAQGLRYELAAHKLLFLVNESRRRRLSGVALKEDAAELKLVP